jgi:dynein heavy chain
MANFVGVLVKGMDATPGGADESAVPKELRVGGAVELEQRVQLLVGVLLGGGLPSWPGVCAGGRAAACLRQKHYNSPPHPPARRPPRQVDTTCATVFNYVAQGLFERHKLIVSTQLCMAVLRQRGELQRAKFDALLRGPKVGGAGDWDPMLQRARAFRPRKLRCFACRGQRTRPSLPAAQLPGE